LNTSILLVGCGRMGSAMLRSWTSASVVVIEPHPLADLPSGVVQYHDLPSYLAAAASAGQMPAPDLVIFAVKPQVIDEVVPAYAVFSRTTFLSIAAGKTLAVFERHLGPDAAIVRAMPNTPAAIGQGITVCVANKHVRPTGHMLVTGALKAGGAVEWVQDEAQMDAVTAVSGSGPAYVFLLVEVMANAGIAMGLPADLAMKLARQTVIGSGHLLQQSPALSATSLRESVTSPGGTTAAALAVLQEQDALAVLFESALKAAQARSQALAQ